MKINFFKTLRFKLGLLFALFAVLPLLGISALFITNLESTLFAEQKTAVNKQLSLVNDTVESVFDSMLSNVKYYAESSLLQTVDASLASYIDIPAAVQMTPDQNSPNEQAIYHNFAEFGTSHPTYQYVYLGTEDGGYIQYPMGSMDPGFDPRERPWYGPAKSQPGSAVLSEPYYYAVDDIVIIGASQAIVGADGRTLGVMAMDMSLAALTDLFEEATEGSKGYYMVATADGTILADPSNEANNFKNLAEAYDESFGKAVAEHADFREITIDGEIYFIKSMPAEQTGWSYISVISKAELFASANQLGRVILFVLLAVLIVVLAAGVVVSSGIAKPIKAVTQAAFAVSEGDFNVNIRTKASGEVGLLVDAFQKIGVTLQEYKQYIEEITAVLHQIADGNMAFQLESAYIGEFSAIKAALLNISRNLTHTLTQIKISSEQIAAGSDQVASGAQALSQGATEQAASVEELSSTISEISGQISSNAVMADQANALAGEAAAAVSVGSTQMQTMIEAMDEINGKANEISTILKVIDDIAFQTNILALNAAVEAARAGDAGKGFAVVADEVRNLAQKTADATGSTAALIEGSMQATRHGTDVVGQTAASLSKIVDNVQNVAGLLESITEASAQQSDAVRQIATGVEQVSAVVQTNAATAEESAASSEELSAQASVLDGLVREFRFDSQT